MEEFEDKVVKSTYEASKKRDKDWKLETVNKKFKGYQDLQNSSNRRPTGTERTTSNKPYANVSQR